jgi:TldD protein
LTGEETGGFPPREDLEKALAAARAKGAEFAEIFLERRLSDAVRVEEEVVREASRGIGTGAGVRAIIGDQIGYAYTDGIDKERLIEAARIAGEIASGGSSGRGRALGRREKAPQRSPVAVPPSGVVAQDKIGLARQAEQAARDHDSRVVEVLVALLDSERAILVANSEGTHISDHRTITSLRITTVAESRDLRQRGFHSLSGTKGYEVFQEWSPESCAEDAARQAVRLLEARQAPAGKMKLVLGNGRGGVLLHEAIGHGLEGDFIRKGTSLFTGRAGEKVASEACTVVDDSTVPGMRGSLNVDDEGTPGGRTVLIEKGILKAFLFDRLSAALMDTQSTGNGRRQSYKHPPVVRMTNTFMPAGDTPPEEIIESVDRGLYAKRIGGGQVDIASGNFVFEVTEGYMIENGRVGPPVRGANLIGNGAEILKKIVMVGNDFMFDSGGGTCGKAGQGVPVGNGLPTLLISEITVGGTES